MQPGLNHSNFLRIFFPSGIAGPVGIHRSAFRVKNLFPASLVLDHHPEQHKTGSAGCGSLWGVFPPKITCIYTSGSRRTGSQGMMHIATLVFHILCWTWAICSVDAQTETLLSFPFVGLDLTPVFDNVAAAPEGSGLADFDSKGASFDSQFLPTGKWVHDGVTVRPISLFF
jgi:hypothetical protein